MKKVIRLTESELIRIVKQVISEQETELQSTKCQRDNDCADALDMHLGSSGLDRKYKKVDNGSGRYFYVGTNQYGDSIKLLVPMKNDTDLLIFRKPKGLMKKTEQLKFKLPESLGGNNVSVDKWTQYLK